MDDVQYIDFRMGEFSLAGDSLGEALDAIIVGVGPFERSYFSAPYQPGKPPAALACKSTGGVISGPEPQAESCDVCPRKADRSCRGHQNIGLCVLDGTLARLRLPGKSVVTFTQYKNMLRGQGIPLNYAVTEIIQDPAVQYKCFSFRYLGKLEPSQVEKIYNEAKEAGFSPLSDPSSMGQAKRIGKIKWEQGGLGGEAKAEAPASAEESEEDEEEAPPKPVAQPKTKQRRMRTLSLDDLKIEGLGG